MKPLQPIFLLVLVLAACQRQPETAVPPAPEPSPSASTPAAGATPTDITAKIAEASLTAEKGKIFILSEAAPLPELKAGGFAEEPAFEDGFGPDWNPQAQGWRIATWKQNGTQMSADRCVVNDEGFLVQTVSAGEPPSGGSMQSTREFGWGRWVARVKPSAVPGLLNSIFTKDWDDLKTGDSDRDGRKAEVDIEFVTHAFRPGSGEVHLAIHLERHHPLWHVDIPLNFNPSDAFHEWGFDILPDRVVWHVDGKVLHTWHYADAHRVDPDYEFFFNSWTRAKWLKGPPLQDGHYKIDWVRFYPLIKDTIQSPSNP